MKKVIFLVAISAFPIIGLSQIEVSSTALGENNIAITLSDGGVFAAQQNFETFGSPELQMTLPGCEYPKGSGNHIMKGLAMWFGGVNEFDEPRTSAPTKIAYEDQFSGTIRRSGSFYQGEENPTAFHTITREEINYHITNYQNPNYVMSENIGSWRAHGDVSINQEFNLLPFVDVDGDGVYNPYYGDYPCVKGDKAVYLIMNDVQGGYSCGSPRNMEGLGIQIHYLFYQYSSIPELANTIFCEARLINRSQSNYTDFSASVFMNALIGSGLDDFVGTDVQRDMIFAYNGEEVDLEYGSQSPAAAIVSLNKSISRTRVFGNYPNYGYHFPTFPPEFWEVMQGNLLTGETYPKRFGYPGDPVLQEGDIQSVSGQANSMIYTIDIGDFSLGEELLFDFAIVVGQGANHLSSITRLKANVDFTKEFYEEGLGDCFQGILGIPDVIDPPQEPISNTIYPNPSHGEFVVEVEEKWMGADLTVYSSNGIVLSNTKNVSELQNTVRLVNGPGVYLVTLTKDGISKTFKAVVE